MSNKVHPVPIDEAIQWTKNWREKHPDMARAFLIRIEDILAAMEEMGITKTVKKPFIVTFMEKTGLRRRNDQKSFTMNSYGKAIRAYMAINTEDPLTNGEKLLIVGTTYKSSEGIYCDMVAEGKNPTEDIDGSGVFDFTMPCPTACDPDSPLN